MNIQIINGPYPTWDENMRNKEISQTHTSSSLDKNKDNNGPLKVVLFIILRIMKL